MTPAAVQLALGREVAFRFSDAEREVFRRRERLTPSAWAARYLVLPDSAERKGRWQKKNAPHTVEPMDTWARPWVVHVLLCLPPQSAKTMTMVITKLWAIDYDPGPVMTAFADADTIRRFTAEYLVELLDASPHLRRLKSQNPDDTTMKLVRLRNGAKWYFSNANNPKDLATVPVRYADADERCKWPKQSGQEKDTRDSSPWRLLFMRTRSYRFTKKLFSASSVRTEDDDMWTALREDAQEHRVYLAYCPHCGTGQRMVWPRFRLAEGLRFQEVTHQEVTQRDLGRYACAACEAEWDDEARDQAVQSEEWQAVAPQSLFDPDHWDDPFPPPPEEPLERPSVVAFHGAAWVSTFVSLSEVVAEFMRAAREPDPDIRRALLMAWTNNYPNKPWREDKPAAVEEDALRRRVDARPEGLVPPEALGLLLTADVQGDGIWYEVRAWGEHGTSWGLQHGFLPKGVLPPELVPGAEGLLSDDMRALLLVANQAFADSRGGEHRVRFGLVDSGYRTDEVYELCRVAKTLLPSKGVETESKRVNPLTYSELDTYPGTKKKIPGGLKLVSYSPDVWKDALARRLLVEPGHAGAWHLHTGTGPDYLAHFRAEARDELSGHWELRGRRPNHLFDCAVLQVIAHEMLGRPPYRLWTPRLPPSPPAPPAAPRSRFKIW